MRYRHTHTHTHTTHTHTQHTHTHTHTPLTPWDMPNNGTQQHDRKLALQLAGSPAGRLKKPPRYTSFTSLRRPSARSVSTMVGTVTAFNRGALEPRANEVVKMMLVGRTSVIHLDTSSKFVKSPFLTVTFVFDKISAFILVVSRTYNTIWLPAGNN